LTEVACSGNKIRKLEFSMADALAKGQTVITCGGAQSTTPGDRYRRRSSRAPL